MERASIMPGRTWIFVVAAAACVHSLSAEGEALRSMRYIPGTPEAARQWQQAARGALLDRLHMTDLVSSTPRPPLTPERVALEQCDGFSLEEFRIQSTAGRTILVMVARPAGVPGPVPAVVAIHGHGGSRRSPFNPEEKIYKEFGSVLARRGFVVASTDVGQHAPFEPGRLVMGERLWDVMRCVDLLASLPEVDAKRIGCAGLSLGGEMAMWLGAMDERIAATVSCGFLTRMDHMEKNHCMCWKFDGLRELVDWPDIYSMIAPRPLQCQNGLKEPANDFVVPIAQDALRGITPIYQTFGAAEKAVLHVHGGAHEIDLPALMNFLSANLKPAGIKQ